RRAVTDRVADGDIGSATQAAPAAARASLRATYDAAFAGGLDEILVIAAALAVVGVIAAVVLVRARDLWRPPAPDPPAPGTPAPHPGTSAPSRPPRRRSRGAAR